MSLKNTPSNRNAISDLLTEWSHVEAMRIRGLRISPQERIFHESLRRHVPLLVQVMFDVHDGATMRLLDAQQTHAMGPMKESSNEMLRRADDEDMAARGEMGRT